MTKLAIRSQPDLSTRLCLGRDDKAFRSRGRMGNLLPMLIVLFSAKVLSEITVKIIQYPVLVKTLTNKSMIRRPGPVFNGIHQSMFDRIVMNIIDVLVQVLLVPYLMFPEPPLPNAAFSLFLPRKALSGFMSPGIEISTGESFFD